jgi:hypothetical protein
MKYKISTDKAIIKYISDAKDGEAILHACVGNKVLHQAEGVVTACDTNKRIVTLQMGNGSKNSYSFDHISVPDAQGQNDQRQATASTQL